MLVSIFLATAMDFGNLAATGRLRRPTTSAAVVRQNVELQAANTTLTATTAELNAQKAAMLQAIVKYSAFTTVLLATSPYVRLTGSSSSALNYMRSRNNGAAAMFDQWVTQTYFFNGRSTGIFIPSSSELAYLGVTEDSFLALVTAQLTVAGQ